MFHKPDLEVCAKVHAQLLSGDPIPDLDLLFAIEHLNIVCKYIEALHERRYDLFLARLQEDLQTLEGFSEARKASSALLNRFY